MSKLIPRLSYEQLDPQLAEMLRPKVERLKYLGEFFQCAGHQPRALMSFHQLTEDLKHALPDNLTELVALSVAAVMGNDYERVQHERLSLKLGFGEEWVRAVLALAPDAPGELSQAERLAQKLTLALVERRGHDTASETDALVEGVGHEQAVGVLMLVGRYMMHALIANCLALEPPVASPLGGEVQA